MTKETQVRAAVDIGDLDSIDAMNKGVEIELVHPTTGAKLGIFVTVLGQDSDVFRDAIREKEDEGRRRAAMASRTGQDVPVITSEQLEAQATDMLCLCTVGWRSETYDEKGEVIADKPVIVFKGEELAFNVPNGRILYSRLLWMRKQVDKAIGTLALFIKP